MAEEYFIRAPEDETARGPYGISELETLAEADKLTPEFYYFDSQMESWAQIQTNEDLKAKIFPEKKRLSLRKKSSEEIASLILPQFVNFDPDQQHRYWGRNPFKLNSEYFGIVPLFFAT